MKRIGPWAVSVSSVFVSKGGSKATDASVSPHSAPTAVKRRRFFDLNDDGEKEDVDGDEMVVKREAKRVLRKGAVRKLGDDFERVANDKDSAGRVKRSFSDGIGIDVESEVVNKKWIVKGLKKGKDELQPSGTKTITRCYPRLAKRG
ncbi:Glycosyl hydrolase superfamily protein [Hibiscus syriacus]|uniref:Glycosyl hydrolase superfamily protein n=1 Tax=Hibiscus syriacus TaxID=106335 RepID=A0A6A3BH70_HIBSY|nr:Glycosyl hydrolase superfamily protein [Hibiscus syriacus]